MILSHYCPVTLPDSSEYPAMFFCFDWIFSYAFSPKSIPGAFPYFVHAAKSACSAWFIPENQNLLADFS